MNEKFLPLLPLETRNSIHFCVSPPVRSISGHTLRLTRAIKLNFFVSPEFSFEHSFFISTENFSAPLLLGSDFLLQKKCVLDFPANKVLLLGTEFPFSNFSSLSTAFVENQNFHSNGKGSETSSQAKPFSFQSTARVIFDRVTGSTPTISTSVNSDRVTGSTPAFSERAEISPSLITFPVLMHNQESIVLPSRASCFLPFRVSKRLSEFHNEYIISPHPASCNHIFIPETVVRVKDGSFTFNIVNLSASPLVIHKKSPLLFIEPFFESVNTDDSFVMSHVSKSGNEFLPDDAFLPNQLTYDQFQTLLDQKVSHMPREHKQAFKSMLNTFFSPPNSFPATNLYTATIETNGLTSYKPPYPLPYHYRKPLDKLLSFLQDNGIIAPSSSTVFNSPIFVVPKPHSSGFRFISDSRALNSITQLMSFPIPSMEECLLKLHDKKFISCLDLTSSFYSIPLDEKSQDATTFYANGKTWKYLRLSFGLKNSSFQFSRAMHLALAGHEEYSMSFIDDLFVMTKESDWRIHLSHVENLLDAVVNKGKFIINWKKTQICQTRIHFLGNIVEDGKLKIDPAKIASIQSYPPPKSVKELLSFLGLANFVRNFIPNYSSLTVPLHGLLRKNVSFLWGKEQQEAFQILKNKISEDCMLFLPDLNQRMYLITDASQSAFGGILMQKYGNNLRPISYYSASFSDSQRRWPILVQELFALLRSVEHFRLFLAGRNFCVLVDHKPLIPIIQTKHLHTGIVGRFVSKLLNYDFDIHYINTTANPSDALTRIVPLSSPTIHSLLPVSTVEYQPIVMRDLLLTEQRKDTSVKFLKKLIENPDYCPPQTSPLWTQTKRFFLQGHFSFDFDGLLIRSAVDPYGSDTASWTRQYIVPATLRKSIFLLYHKSPTWAHSGSLRTYQAIFSQYAWPNMKQDITEWSRSCDICQRENVCPSNKPRSGTLSNVHYPLNRISIDFIGPLKISSKGSRFVLTMVDEFSGYIVCVPLKTISAKETAKALVFNFFLVYGFPECILSDNGKAFVSELYQHTLDLLRVKYIYSCFFCPTGHSRVENSNRLVSQTLRKLIADLADQNTASWCSLLPFACYSLNSTLSRTRGVSPYFAFFGRKPANPMAELGTGPAGRFSLDYFPHNVERAAKIVQNQVGHTLRASNRRPEQFTEKIFLQFSTG